jgi:hypothetical protein
MSAAFILLALSALIGFALGMSFLWLAIAASSIGIAVLSSAILQIQGFSALPGIAIIVACLTVHQFAYVMGAVLATRRLEGAKKSRERHEKAAKARAWPNLIKLASWPTRRRTKRK